MKQKINFEDIKKRLGMSDTNFGTIYEMSDIVENFGAQDKKIKPLLANYIVIRLVSIIEGYFKTQVRELIDEHDLDISKLLPNNELTISLTDFDEIQKNPKITKGRLISYMIHYQNLGQIDSTMSRLLNLKGFFTEIKRGGGTYGFKNGDDVEFKFKVIVDLFVLRHKLIHEMYQIPEKDYKNLKIFYANSVIFLGNSSIIMEPFLKKKQKP